MKIDMKQNSVIKALASFGFEVKRRNEHIVLRNAKGEGISIPNHKRIKGSTLSKELTRLGIDKQKFFTLV